MPPSTTDIPESVRAEVRARLAQIEVDEDVRVFYACESGSRAWGFPSADSDFDVRFLYAHPHDWYLSIDVERRRDVIERPIDDTLDISGWDLRKALRLLRKSNPPLLEWLQSPIVYREETPVAARLRALMDTCYAPRAAMHHYLHMAKGNARAYLKDDDVRVKKYFYILRPLLAIRWIEADRGPVPMEFEVLLDQGVDDEAVLRATRALLAAKRAGDELDRGPRIPTIDRFIEAELDRLESPDVEGRSPTASLDDLNRAFRQALDVLWTGG